ncbi:MAG: transglycosylase SLT domain-containing protein [Pyrinomonadaceae bacterium]|nr:transglycosylase SLT domain-containing protein [Pyrinomonadaceae bacterium]MBP6211852.1 transglycosylase SLT domain-containing protein [Pyrinomonadaceae bacterium]
MLRRYLNFSACCAVVFVLFSVGCSAQQTEDQALQSLRQMTSNGKLPPEDLVASIESRFAGKRTGALAKLLHARIRFEANDFAGAAALLRTDEFKKRTKLAEHALWLRARALQQAGDHAEAMNVASELLRDHPDFLRTRDVKLLWANSAIQASRAVDVPGFLVELTEKNDADALLTTAKAFETQGSQPEALRYYRRTYFFAAGSAAAKEAEAKLTSLGQPLTPQNSDEQLARADKLAAARSNADAIVAYADLAARFPTAMTPAVQLRRVTSAANGGKMPEAQLAFSSIPAGATEREDAYRQLVLGYAKAKMWPQVRSTADAMRQNYPNGKLVAKTLIDAGLAARDAKNRTDEGYFFNTAVAAFPNAIEVATAQFEAGWFQHESGNFALSSQMFIDHLARFAGKDTTNRGKAGYWAARDSERSGKIAEACALYEGTIYRYSANWYGYLAMGRMTTLKNQGNCRSTAAPNDLVARAVANLKTVTVAAETATARETARAERSEELSIIGVFDWAIDELQEAKKAAPSSPKINMALARHYRFKGDNTAAFLALRTSYPDYAQMFPEEMGREEWSIFYPLVHWTEIKHWATERRLDPYQVAGLIRQESVFTPAAKSPANAYGLMQLLVPTAQSMARKYISKTASVNSTALFQPQLNIELGTAYMRDQLDKFGRIEYLAVAYNAGPGRVPQWRATLPAEMDEFVEEIPFKETKGYVQGVIRNSAQYRRLYDESGNFKPNVGTRPLRGEIDGKPRDQFAAEFPEVVVENATDE